MNTRREFIKTTAGALGAAAVLGRLPLTVQAGEASRSRPFGFQTWTVREELAADLPGTLKRMAAMGYSETEFCSPHGYTGTPFEKFTSLSASELRSIIADSGLTCESTHFGFAELRDSLDHRIEWAREMGLRDMVCSSFWLPNGASLDDYRRSCDDLNAIGARIKAAGMQAGFHNHHMEFEKRDGTLIYDAMLERLDPSVVKMQFQVAVVNIGYKAADYFRAHPGRFISAHLADWSAAENRQVPIGSGIVNWKDFFAAAKIGGATRFYVEMDPQTFSESAEFLKVV